MKKQYKKLKAEVKSEYGDLNEDNGKKGVLESQGKERNKIKRSELEEKLRLLEAEAQVKKV